MNKLASGLSGSKPSEMLVIDKLILQIDKKSCPIAVGLDPVIQNIPDFIKRRALEKHGNTPKGAAEAIYQFNAGLLEKLSSLVPAAKLQMACYELYGSFGVEVFCRTVKHARKLGLIVIDDSKRNDIGHTAKLYAQAHLGDIPLIKGVKKVVKPDFMTVNPYLGSDGLEPFVEECEVSGKGIFILARTSNPSSAEYQEALVDGLPLYKKIAGDARRFGLRLIGESGYSSIGAVAGATWPGLIKDLRESMPSSYLLLPGYGAQGADGKRAALAFNRDGYGALINSSREIIFAFRNPRFQKLFPEPELYAEAAAKAVRDMREDLLISLSQADKLPSNWKV